MAPNMINVYSANETNFNNNGLVVLSDCTTAYVEEMLNDKYEVELEYPIDVRGKWAYIMEGNILKAEGQLFRIYHKEKTLAGIKANARHIFYDFLDNFVESCSIGNLNAAGALSAILSNTQYSHGFTSMSDIDVANTYAIDKQNPVDAIMGQNGVIAKYGGELLRDNFTIRLYQARGLDRGVLVSYGKNVLGIDETIDMSSVVTRLMPIGKNGLLLPEKYLDSSLINSYPHPIVKSLEFSDCETADDLRTAGQTYLSQNDRPLVNYQVDFIELTKTTEYENYAILESVYMGDTVTVRHSRLGIDLKCKVIRIKKNELTNRIEEVELGSFKPTLASSINTTIGTIINQQAQDKSDLQEAIDDATAQINNALGGYVVKRNGELLIMDTEDINTATKVWRWNEGGLGYSSTGYNGPYRTAITADGQIVADFITAGTLDGSLLKVGTITSKTGKLSIGLDDEVLNIGGQIIYDGSTNQVTFGPNVVLSWNSIEGAPTIPPPYTDAEALAAWEASGYATYIGKNGIYTGNLTANQINAISGIHLGEGATIDWNGVNPPTASEVGALPTGWTPDLSAYITSDSVNSKLLDLLNNSNLKTIIGEDYIVTGKIAANQIAVGTLTGFELDGATIKAGKIIGDNNSAILDIGKNGGAIDTEINVGDGGVQQSSIRLKPGSMSNGDAYLQVVEDGSVYFYNSSGQVFAYIHPDGSTNLSSSGGGGGGDTEGFKVIKFAIGLNTIPLNIIGSLAKRNESLVIDNAGALICTISGRAFTKVNGGKAYAAYWYEVSGSTGFTGPFLVSTDPNAVSYSALGITFTSSGSFVYNGVTYYYSNTGYYMQGNYSSSAGAAATKLTTTSDVVSAATEILDRYFCNGY